MIPQLKQQQILSLLGTGLSISEVAARTQVARNTILSIKKKSKTKRCSVCGAAVNILPCVECQPAKISIKKKKVRAIKLNDLMKAYTAEAPELFRIVEDLRSLYELGLIEHRLFMDLGKRAVNSFKRIYPPTEENNAKKKENTE